VWVKVGSIPTTGTTLLMYYGDSSLTNGSNGPATFLAYADFNQDEGFSIVDNGTTRSFGQSGTYVSTANQRVDFIGLPADGGATYVYKDYGAGYFGDSVVEFDGIQTSAGSASVAHIGLGDGLGMIGSAALANAAFSTTSDYQNDVMVYVLRAGSSSYGWPYPQTGLNVRGYVRLAVRPSTGEVTQSVYTNAARTNLLTNCSSAGCENPKTLTTGPIVSLRHLYALNKSTGGPPGRSITGSFDNLRVRKFANPEPAATLGPEQQ